MKSGWTSDTAPLSNPSLISNSGLAIGVGVSLGVLVTVLVLGAVIYVCYRKRKQELLVYTIVFTFVIFTKGVQRAVL